MKGLQLSFIALFAISLCSFGLYSKENKKKLYKAFIAKFDNKKAPASFVLKSSEKLESANFLENKKKNLDENKKKIVAKSNKSIEKRLSNDYDVFIPGISSGMMSRLGPSIYTAEVLVASTASFDALIYSRSRSYRGNKNFVLVTFDKKGNKIEEKRIGYSYSNKHYKVSITKKLEMTINTVEESEENGVVISEVLEVLLADDGKIVTHEASKTDTNTNEKENQSLLEDV